MKNSLKSVYCGNILIDLKHDKKMANVCKTIKYIMLKTPRKMSQRFPDF